jgi:hypothetical protein
MDSYKSIQSGITSFLHIALIALPLSLKIDYFWPTNSPSHLNLPIRVTVCLPSLLQSATSTLNKSSIPNQSSSQTSPSPLNSLIEPVVKIILPFFIINSTRYLMILLIKTNSRSVPHSSTIQIPETFVWAPWKLITPLSQTNLIQHPQAFSRKLLPGRRIWA